MIMRNNKIRSSLVVALATAVTLTSFNLPAQAAPKNTPQGTHQLSKSVATDFSARRRHYSRGNSAAALAMFGIVAGGIAAAAAADRYNDRYYGDGPYYGGPAYGYRGGYYGGGPRWHGGGHHHWHR
jgi:hypothetical protein